MIGCKKRMGWLVIQEQGISIEMMLGVMDILEDELGARDMDARRKGDVIVAEAALVILYGGALRGGDIFLLEPVSSWRDARMGNITLSSSLILLLPYWDASKMKQGRETFWFLCQMLLLTDWKLEFGLRDLWRFWKKKAVRTSHLQLLWWVFMPRARIKHVLHGALNKLQSAERPDI